MIHHRTASAVLRYATLIQDLVSECADEERNKIYDTSALGAEKQQNILHLHTLDLQLCLMTSSIRGPCLLLRSLPLKTIAQATSTMARAYSSQAFTNFPLEIRDTAKHLEDARSKNYQIPPLTATKPDLSQDTGYRIASAIRALRCERNNDVIVGRKIGFTNKSIWPEFNVDRSNWSYMYRSSVVDLNVQEHHAGKPIVCDLSEFSNLETKIEPEIVLGLKANIASSMGDEEILGCIEWIAHGFEMVASVYPGWKFTAADTTAAFALHGKLLLGRKTYLSSSTISPQQLLRQLEAFKITLHCNDALADEGFGSNVLGSPIKALRHLAELLEKDEVNLALEAGEMVTTGTLTRALSVADEDRWRTEIDGLDVAPLDVKFKI